MYNQLRAARARLEASRENGDKGFTLIELLIVIVILGILAGIVVFAVSGITDRGAKSACQSSVKTVQTAAEADFAQNGSYPADGKQMVTDGFLHDDPTAAGYNANYTVTYAVDATTGRPTVTGKLKDGTAC